METFKILLFLCMIFLECALSSEVYNVVDYGAVGDGKTEDSQAFMKAWEASCSSSGDWPTVYVPPRKTFLVKPVAFLGPCKSTKVRFQVLGDLVGPSTMEGWDGAAVWLLFHYIHGLTIDGSGRIGGQGPIWWQCRTDPKMKCQSAPTAIAFSNCDDLHVKGLTLFDNPRNHISMNECNRVYISNMVITAPKDSPNTDGINIGSSKNVNIWDSTIGTGDDCISVLSGTSNVNISRIACGPGHGISVSTDFESIRDGWLNTACMRFKHGMFRFPGGSVCSIGSLGGDQSFAAVDQVHVYHSTFTGTSNGARIKTWQGGSGYARGISFEHVKMKSVEFPIIIDQYYCFDNSCKNQTSAVKVSDLRFADIYGTSSGVVAINLACSESVACTDVVLADVKLLPARRGTKIHSYCLNAHGPSCTSCTPRVPCLG